LRPGDRLADLGAGTGLLTQLFADAGYAIDAIEPNAPMREAGERSLQDKTEVRFVDGRAEASTLEPASVDLVIAGQAFHWFEVAPTIVELRRILTAGGRVALIWNVRDEEGDPFMAEYEQLLARHGTGYRNVGAHGVDPEARRQLFGSSRGRFDRLHNAQKLDREGLIGRVLSSSYAPDAGSHGHEEMVEALELLFEKYACDNQVTLRYRTEVYHDVFRSD
jgi:ubiquinone/menaquinone biosynthesis C-methylase UbiE